MFGRNFGRMTSASTVCWGSGFRSRATRSSFGFVVALGAGASSAAVVLHGVHGAPVHCDGQPDRLHFWKSKWDANQIAFHMEAVNPNLLRYYDQLLPDRGEPHAVGMGPRVLIPLCGKAVDMAFLARKGFRVVGTELVRKAIDDFAVQNGVMGHSVSINLPPSIDSGSFRGHAVLIGAGQEESTRAEPPPPVIFIEGDFLKLGPEEAKVLVPFPAVFDRGSLVAILPESRKQYACAVTELVEVGGRVLLIAVEHDPFKSGLGPPFEVTEADVKELYAAEFEVRLLHREDRMEKEPAWRERGATRFNECAYLLTKRAPSAKL